MKNKSVVEFMIKHLNECLSFTVDHYGLKSETVNLTYQQKQDIIRSLSDKGETVIIFDEEAETKQIVFIYGLLTRPVNLFFKERENPIEYISDNIDEIFSEANTNTPFGYIQEVIEIAIDTERQYRKIISLEDANHSYREGELTYSIKERCVKQGAALSYNDIIIRFHPVTHTVTEVRQRRWYEKHAADLQGYDPNDNCYVIIKPERDTTPSLFFNQNRTFCINTFFNVIAGIVIDIYPNADFNNVFNELTNNLSDAYRRDIQALLEQHAGITPQQNTPTETILNPDSNQQQAMPKVNKI